MEEDIPIDIHIPKLLEWLISRRHCQNGWQAQINMIREKINVALEDMPEHEEIVKLLSGSYINYFHCCQIINILKETEADTRNLFGMYGSKRMKDWQEVVRLYKKDNVYLAEAANILLRNVKFEVPNIKKQITKYKQMQQDCDKKMSEYVKSITSFQKELQTMKKQLGISGDNIRNELLSRTSYLSEIYENVVSNIKYIGKAIQYYSIFSHYVAGESYKLPLISYIIEKGNTTTYEWLYGEAPENIQQHIENTDPVIENNNSEEIEWDITTDEDVHYEFDITVDESGIELESSNEEKNIAKGNEAYSVLDNPETREEFISQLVELQSFLKMRLLETQKNDDSIFTMDENIEESSDNIVKMLDSVQVVKQLMTDSLTQQLHFIKHSKRYVNKVTGLFNQKLSSIEKFVASQEVLKQKKEEFIQNENELKPKLEVLIEKTRQLQEQIEREISLKYKNRPVHLIGGF